MAARSDLLGNGRGHLRPTAAPCRAFDNAGVDREFFSGADIRSNFLCHLGYGDRTGMLPRAARFAFDEVASIL
jgi:3-hydroxypropanoate dehydrogenase